MKSTEMPAAGRDVQLCRYQVREARRVGVYVIAVVDLELDYGVARFTFDEIGGTGVPVIAFTTVEVIPGFGSGFEGG